MRDHYQTERVQMLHCSRKLRDLRGKIPILVKQAIPKKMERPLLALGNIRKKGMVCDGGLN